LTVPTQERYRLTTKATQEYTPIKAEIFLTAGTDPALTLGGIRPNAKKAHRLCHKAAQIKKKFWYKNQCNLQRHMAQSADPFLFSSA
jgi:hypothetical protein